MGGGEAIVRKRMKRRRLRKPALSQNEGARPRYPAFLAPIAQSTPPQRKHPIPKHPQAPEVSWYRKVVEVSLHDRLESPSGWVTGSCIRVRSCCLICRSLVRMRLRIAVRRTMKS